MRNNILEFNKIGFINEIEFLPNFFDHFNSKQAMRQLFLNLINCMIPDNCRFNKYEQKYFAKYNLNIAFKSKVKSLRPFSNVFITKPQQAKSFKLCKNSTLIINSFDSILASRSLVSNSNLVPIANFINFSFNKNKFELLIDKDFLFHEFIIKKLKKIHPDKMIIDEGNCVSIVKDKKVVLKLYNSWKTIDKKKPNIKTELDNAIKDINKKPKNDIYLIYPKNKNFDKHIELKVVGIKDNKYKIKIIPYSLRSILRQTI